MPILIKDFTWRQTEDLIIVRVPLHNIPHSKVDIFTSEIYIKVHFPPFLFESCLYGKINEDESKCSLVEGEAVLRLVKQNKSDWPGLSKEISKREMVDIKKQAIQLAHAKATQRLKQRKDERAKLARACVSEEVGLEGEGRKAVEERKEAAREGALAEVRLWEGGTDRTILPARAQAKIKALTESKSANNSINSKSQIFEEPTRNDPKTEDFEAMGPAVRIAGTIGVTFTYRAFPTPSRESKLDEENQWLKKMAEARRKTGFVAEDLRPEENDPEWLLDKGKRFHEVGNFLGAVSAFTHAIRTWQEIPELWVARSSSQLALGNYRRVLNDTTQALELLKPHVSSNEELRFVSHLNRGRALVEVGRAEAGLADYEEALQLRPYCEELHLLIDRAETVLAEQRLTPPTQPFLQSEDLAT